MTAWGEDDFDSIDDLDAFIAAVRDEPTDAQLKALGLYSARRTGLRVERRLSVPPRKRLRMRVLYGLAFLWSWRDMACLVIFAVALWYALAWAIR